MYINHRCRSCCAIIPMNEFCNMNALMVQRRRNCAIITIDVFVIANVTPTQLGTSCSFDSPGLTGNEPVLSKRLQGNSTL